MKIYFHSSLIGEKQYLKEYDKIVKILQDLNHEVHASHVFEKKPQVKSQVNVDEIYEDVQRKKNLIKACDTVIVEASYPSIGVGYIIGYALGQHKSVLVLYQETAHAMLISENNRLLHLKKYSIKDENLLIHDLKLFLEVAQRKILKYRFNMMIDQSTNDVLNQESGKLSISKADYVRQLISDKLMEHKK